MTTRRAFLSGFLALPALVPAVARGQTMPELSLTPSCGAETVAQTEGPYFTPDTPLKRDFRADVDAVESGGASAGSTLAIGGTPIAIAGYVLTRDCQPVPGALIELWHCDGDGAYDNEGHRLRGHQFSDDQGRWWFETIVPGIYTGRTRHFHVKVQRPDGPVLTTQLYFPGEPGNERDRIFDASLVLDIKPAPDGGYGRYDFVVA